MNKTCIKKGIALFGVLSLLASNLAYADEIDPNSDYVLYDYTTGTASTYEITEVNSSARMSNGDEELISPAYNLSDTSPRSIIGPDSRIRVNPNDEPYSKILCLYLGRDKDGDGVVESWALGTGFMVANNVMLTAGHNMYNRTNGYIQEMRIFVKQNSTSLDSTYYHPASWVMSQAYLNNTGNSNYDWCVVKLQNNLGTQTGWFGYGVADSSKSITVSGYPGDSEHAYFQYAASGTLKKNSVYRFSHDCDTTGGQSGSPAYDSNHIAWGIHKAGSTGGNAGNLITSDLFNIIGSMK